MVERYAHLAPEYLAHAAKRIDRLFGGYETATREKGNESSDSNPL